eukprot:5189679-Amphidinium_carterae.1
MGLPAAPVEPDAAASVELVPRDSARAGTGCQAPQQQWAGYQTSLRSPKEKDRLWLRQQGVRRTNW